MTATATESSVPAAAAEEGTRSAEAWTTPAVTPLPAVAPAPAPVVAPYLGFVACVLCALCGGWLLLAPYALDLRRGAVKLPRAAAVDLETGAAIAALSLLSAIFFAAALFSRLRPQIDPAEYESETDQEAAEYQFAEPEPEGAEPGAEPESEPEPEPEPPAAAASGSNSALREMLTPLVAALAADLRIQDQRRRQEP